MAKYQDDNNVLVDSAFILAEADQDKHHEALEIFHNLQAREDVALGAKFIAPYIPLFLGEPEEAKHASQRLVKSGVLSPEWRIFKRPTEYVAGERSEDAARFAGPVRSACYSRQPTFQSRCRHLQKPTVRKRKSLAEDCG